MKNVTITLEEKTAAWIKVYAAERGMSVSRVVGELLATRMHDLADYERAKRSFLSKSPHQFDGSPYPKREELYDRGRLR